ncbi:MAG: sulfotransferase family 2 domain-containing protein [Akkermansiaceae bacterium]|nr:sulfotransferase family 2 domain-containing protein [Akkermansiaceae bacterium]
MLAFIHIPKTAGTTLHKILSHQYPRTFIRHDSDGPPDAALAKQIREADTQLIMGHFSVGLHRFIPEIRYVTCLRKPEARLLSHYHHALNDPAHYLHQEVVSKNLSLADYIASGLSGELANGMTRMLAGIDNFHHGEVNAETLANAKSNIENLFDGVILSESFDPSLLLLADSLHWKTPYYIRRKVGRYTSGSRRLDEDARTAIAEHNRFDCELYEWANTRFESQASSIPDLGDRTLRFQRANRVQGKAIFCLRELKSRMQPKQ